MEKKQRFFGKCLASFQAGRRLVRGAFFLAFILCVLPHQCFGDDFGASVAKDLTLGGSLQAETPNAPDGKLSFVPDDAGNIAYYRELEAAMPNKESKHAFATLIDAMEKQHFPTVFNEGILVEPLGFEGEIYASYNAGPDFDCKKTPWLNGVGSVPVFIFGDGVNFKCLNGRHFIFTGSKDDYIEMGDWGLNFFFPGKGNDSLKLKKGLSVTVLEKNWGHKTIEKECETVEDLRYGNRVTKDIYNEYGGIGLGLTLKDSSLQVINAYFASPAMLAGIQAGDIIVQIDGKSVVGMSQGEATALLRGEPGTEVKLSYMRPGTKSSKSVTLKRKLLRSHKGSWMRGEQGPEIHDDVDYKRPYKYLSSIIFGHGISPETTQEESPGVWIDKETGDTVKASDCFNFIFADDTTDQARVRTENQEIKHAEQKEEMRRQYPILPPAPPPGDKAPPEKPCPVVADDAGAIIKRFPVVLDGSFVENGGFKAGKIYKGFRNWPIDFSPEAFKGVEFQPGKHVLVLADFIHGRAAVSRCGAVLHEDGKFNGVTFGALLSEAAVYEAVASTKMASFPQANQDYNNERMRTASMNYLKDNGDYLYHLELSAGLLRDAVDKAETNPNDNYFRDPRAQCGKQVDSGGDGFSGDMKASILKGYKLLGTTGGGPGNAYVMPIRFALREAGLAFFNVGEYAASLFTLCGSDASTLYLMAALAGHRSDLVSGNELGNVSEISDLDLSGLDLRRIRAAGTWKNIKVTGTDFSKSSFSEVKFDNVNLADATTDLATYYCKTEFPAGFDPVLHHMIPYHWERSGCSGSSPKINLDNVKISDENISNIEDGFRLPQKSDLHDISARAATLGIVICEGCNIFNADFSGTQVRLGHVKSISDTSFRDASLQGSVLHYCNFKNVDLSNAHLDQTDLDHATYDAATKFPAGFDPVKAGMQKAEDAEAK